jgi:hypothetical protein
LIRLWYKATTEAKQTEEIPIKLKIVVNESLKSENITKLSFIVTPSKIILGAAENNAVMLKSDPS